MITRLCHEIISLYYSGARKEFLESLDQLEEIQRSRLKKILQNLQETTLWSKLDRLDSYEKIIRQIPVHSYEDYKAQILQQKEFNSQILSPEVIRYEPTSGSTEARKWIPYSRDFLNELNKAAAIWLGDIYQNYPKVKQGAHYWSLSWLPKELRELTSSDDADLFPFYQRWILKNTMAVPGKISHLENPEAAWWASLLYLASNEDLTLVSVWSPTFWLKIVADLKQNWPEIAPALTKGSWGRYQTEISKVLGKAPRRDVSSLNPNDLEFLEKLWPRLSLISAWDSSSSATWADRIRELFPKVTFQGKGLWATEGVLSVPFENKKVLASHSHFYEFKDLETGEILPVWKIQQHRDYQPILWTSSGLLRYQLQDRVRVTGFLQKTPCLEFMGRLQSVDLVGEKMDARWVQSLFEKNPQWGGLCLVGCRKPEPHYVLIHQKAVEIDIEAELLKLHHYRLARELGQLQKARTVIVADIFHFFAQAGRSKIVGQNKIEVLLEMDHL